MNTTQSSQLPAGKLALTAFHNRLSGTPCLPLVLILFAIVLIERIIVFETKWIPVDFGFGSSNLNIEEGRELIGFMRKMGASKWDLWNNPIAAGGMSNTLLGLCVLTAVFMMLKWRQLSIVSSAVMSCANVFQLIFYFSVDLKDFTGLYTLFVIMSLCTCLLGVLILYKLYTEKTIDSDRRILKRMTAIILAFPLLPGALGLHRFYLRQPLWGIAYLILAFFPFLLIIPMIVATIDFVILLRMSDEKFDQKYNTPAASAALALQNATAGTVNADQDSSPGIVESEIEWK